VVVVCSFLYLGGTISSNQYCVKDVERHIGLSAAVAKQLEKFWKAEDLRKAAKVAVIYKALVQVCPALLQRCKQY